MGVQGGKSGMLDRNFSPWICMATLTPTQLRRKVRLLTWICLASWVTITTAPAVMARSGAHFGPWPVGFWMAAQGAVLGYLAIVVVYAWLVNRWEREAGRLSFEVPLNQDD